MLHRTPDGVPTTQALRIYKHSAPHGANQIFCGSLTRDAHFVPIGDHLVRAAEDRAWA